MMQNHDVLVIDVIVLEVAQQRGRHEAAVAHEEHGGAGHLRALLEQLGSSDHGTARCCNARRSFARPSRQVTNPMNISAASTSGTQPPFGIFVALPSHERQVDRSGTGRTRARSAR